MNHSDNERIGRKKYFKIEPELSAYQEVVNNKIELLNQIIDSVQRQCSGEEIYKKFVGKLDGERK